MDDVKDAINEKVSFQKSHLKQTKVVLFAYLFGVRYDITEIAQYCREKGLDVLEDVAQSFAGPARFTGNQHATVTMFSLGMIKIQSTLYGGLTMIRDEELHSKMRAIQETYPAYSKQMFRKRVLAAMAVHQFINTQLGNRVFTTAAAIKGQDREEFYVNLSRGFKPAATFLDKFRLNPCAPLLSFIYQRLASFDYKQFDLDMGKYTVRH